jgi:hypothetical protein
MLPITLIAAGVLCWIIESKDRSENAAQLIAAARGHAWELTHPPPGPLVVRQEGVGD